MHDSKFCKAMTEMGPFSEIGARLRNVSSSVKSGSRKRRHDFHAGLRFGPKI